MNPFEMPGKSKNIEAVKEFSEEERTELINLRKRQMEGPWSEADRRRLLELTAKENSVQKAPPLSPEEKKVYVDLTKRQNEGKDWTPADAEKLYSLQRRADAETEKSKRSRF